MIKIPRWANWVVRNEDGMLIAYSSKPDKDDALNRWVSTESYAFLETEDSDFFDDVKWTDAEPTRIVKDFYNILITTYDEDGCLVVRSDMVNKPNHRNTQTSVPPVIENDLVKKPKHYQNKDGKDLFQKWYEQHDFDTYRHIMRAIAERYTSRYENKNGLEDLEKGIYTLQRLLEIEQADKESDFERVHKLIETYYGGTNPND